MKLCMMSSVLGFDQPLEVIDTALFCGMEAVDWIFPADRNIDPAFLRKISIDAGLKIAAYTSLFGAFIKGEKDWQDKLWQDLVDTALPTANRQGRIIQPVAFIDRMEGYAKERPTNQQAIMISKKCGNEGR